MEEKKEKSDKEVLMEVLNSLVDAINGLQKFSTDTQECLKHINDRLKLLEKKETKHAFSL